MKSLLKTLITFYIKIDVFINVEEVGPSSIGGTLLFGQPYSPKQY